MLHIKCPKGHEIDMDDYVNKPSSELNKGFYVLRFCHECKRPYLDMDCTKKDKNEESKWDPLKQRTESPITSDKDEWLNMYDQSPLFNELILISGGHKGKFIGTNDGYLGIIEDCDDSSKSHFFLLWKPIKLTISAEKVDNNYQNGCQSNSEFANHEYEITNSCENGNHDFIFTNYFNYTSYYQTCAKCGIRECNKIPECKCKRLKNNIKFDEYFRVLDCNCPVCDSGIKNQDSRIKNVECDFTWAEHEKSFYCYSHQSYKCANIAGINNCTNQPSENSNCTNCTCLSKLKEALTRSFDWFIAAKKYESAEILCNLFNQLATPNDLKEKE